MEREELISFLRENLSITVVMDELCESGGTYVTSSVTLQLGDEVISDDYDSVRISE